MRIWLDDVRPMPAEYDVWLRTAEQAILAIRLGGVTAISLDHDLGDESEKTGYDVARFIEEGAFNDTVAPIEIHVHSANAAGRQNIIRAIRKAEKFWHERLTRT
jgi:hypothetical protein